MSTYQDNIETHDLQADIGEAVSFLLQHAAFVTDAQWRGLSAVVGARFAALEERPSDTPFDYDASFSVADELEAQILAVRAVRQRIMAADGSINRDISTREAKEVISSGSTLLGTLMKYHEKVVNMERLRVLEQSVIEALEHVDMEVKDVVLATMEEKLANVV